ncbi:hypothetical protein GCM10020254_20390 [Streptomyces goshikiensis]
MARQRRNPRSLTEFLERAGVRDRYPHYDLGAAEARLLRVPRALGAAVGRSRRRSAGWSDPARDRPLDSERARRDLKAACLAAVCAPAAEAELASFSAGDRTDLAGAVVFGCLLHLSGLREGSRFWWQFAAGSGGPRTAHAAYCLFLDHSRRGEHHDAGVWARELGRRGFRPGGPRDLREVRLCAQAAVLRYVDQLDDPDVGPVPLPRPGLAGGAGRVPPPPPPARPPAPAGLPAVRPGRPGPAPALPLPFALALAPLRHPALTAAARGCTPPAHGTEALAQARRALAVVRVLERHPLGCGPPSWGGRRGSPGRSCGRCWRCCARRSTRTRWARAPSPGGPPWTGSPLPAAGVWRASSSAPWPWPGTARAPPCTSAGTRRARC